MKYMWVILILLVTCVAHAVPTEGQITYAKRTYIKFHPICEWCGSSGSPLNRLNVHHYIPVSVNKDLAADTNNMVTLDRKCHIVLGHVGDMACRVYLIELRQLIQTKKVGRCSEAK